MKTRSFSASDKLIILFVLLLIQTVGVAGASTIEGESDNSQDQNQTYSTWPFASSLYYNAPIHEYHYSSDPSFGRNSVEDSTFIARSPHLEWEFIESLPKAHPNHFYWRLGSPTIDFRLLYPTRTLVATYHHPRPPAIIPLEGFGLSSSIGPSGDKVVLGAPGGGLSLIDWRRASQSPEWAEAPKVDNHTSAIVSVAFSPDGSRILTASNDNTAKLWESKTGRVIRTFQHQSAVECARFSADGSRVATGCRDGVIRIWDISGEGEPVVLLGHKSAVTGIAFNKDSSLLVSADASGIAKIHQYGPNPVIQHTFQAHIGPVTAIQFRPPNEMNFATAGEDGTVRFWHHSGKQLLEVGDHPTRVNTLAFTPDGLRLLLAGEDRKVYCYFVYRDRLELRRTIEGPFVNLQSPIRSLAMHQDGRSFLIGGEQRELFKVDIVTPEATVGQIVANPIVDRQYRETAITGNGFRPQVRPGDPQAR